MTRSTAWVILLTALASSPAAAATAPGRFGNALAVGEQYAAAERNPIYFVVPMTVDCWVKIGAAAGAEKAKSSPTILLAHEPRHSVTHWELYAQKDTGRLAASMPGWDVKALVSDKPIVDGQWHHVAMVFDGNTLRLFADGAQVAQTAVKKTAPYPDTGPLTFGHFPGVESNRDLLLDEVRISRVARRVGGIPTAPSPVDGDTVGFWRFDEPRGDTFADASLTRNDAKLATVQKQAPPGGGFDGTLGARTRWADMDFGPFFSSTLVIPSLKQNVTHKAISVRLDDKHAIAFDTEALRYSVGWSGDFLKIHPFREGLGGPPDVAGEVVFTTTGPGWARPGSDDFADPRHDKLGPLPRAWGRYRGLYVSDDKVAFSYTVGGRDVLDAPSVERHDDKDYFVRTIEVGPGDDQLLLRVADSTEPAKGKDPVGFLLVNRPSNEALHIGDGCMGVPVPASADVIVFAVRVALGPVGTVDEATALAKPSDLTRGGPARYPDPVVTRGTLGTGDGPYVVDTLTPPTDNPWKSFLRFGGLDFFKNGDAAVCSVSGDVWVVSGIDDKLESLKWRRYATGLFQPLGLKIVDEKVYVLGRDQITRLHDLNNDGEADFYENFNSDAKVTTNGHAYVTCLDTDPAGNFFYLKCADDTEHGGTVLRVSKDGGKLDVFATGLRNPNGMAVSPTGQVTAADNQGEWVPASRLDLVEPGEFLGYTPMAKAKTPPTDPGRPLCWMPQNVDNSSGAQTWVTSDRWGPFQGGMLHTSYGAASLLLVLQENVDGVAQGGVVKFPLTFDSGVMRGRFRPQDGQLYLCGLRGWQTAGARDAALHRVRYTGKPVRMPSGLNVYHNGIRLSFTCDLDEEIASDVDSYSLLRWNYKWSGEYGSRQWSLNDPAKQGYDTLVVKSARLLPDGKSVFLEVEDMRPVMQMQIGYDVESKDGQQVRGDVFNTIHALRAPEEK